jgi:hypothetical protein
MRGGAHKVAEADSEDFELGDASISSSASSYPSQSDLDVDIAILNSPKISACYERLFSKLLATSLPAGAKVDSVSIKITPGAAGGPANVVGTGAGVVKVRAVNGQRGAFYLTVAELKGREPVRRGSSQFTFQAAQLRNPLASFHLVGQFSAGW